MLPSIREQLDRNGPIERLSFTVACWFRYLQGTAEDGSAMPLIDPYAAKLREHALRGGADATVLLSLREFFGELPDQPRFVAAVSAHLTRLVDVGARAALEHVLAGAA